MPRSFLALLGASAAAAAIAQQTAPWGGYGDTLYGTWDLDNATGTAVYVFRGGACPVAPSTPESSPGGMTCVPVQGRTPIHIVGNDRHQLYLFSDGSASLRQDEGGPKLLNAYNASAPGGPQFGGAAGFVTPRDGSPAQLLVSTVVNGTVAPTGPVSLVLGAGFSRRVAAPLVAPAVQTAPSVAGVEATLVAPFGDDSVVLSIVTVRGSPGAAGAYTEVWAASRLQFNTAGTQSPLRHAFSPLSDPAARGAAVVGLLDEPVPVAARTAGVSQQQRQQQQRHGAPPPLPQPSFDDPSPRPSFLVCLTCASAGGAGVGSFTSSSAEVYGDGSSGPAQPDAGALTRGLSNSTTETAEGACVSALQVRRGREGHGASTGCNDWLLLRCRSLLSCPSRGS